MILPLQNKWGGFDISPFSSVCADIDAVEPLIRLSLSNPNYRIDEIKTIVNRSADNCLANQNIDHGFVFQRFYPFCYGHINMSSDREKSNLFATWFRTLQLLYIDSYLSNTNYSFVNMPGYEMPLREKINA